MEKKSLPWVTKVSYGVGHVFNDLCASMWFTYLLVFYQNVSIGTVLIFFSFPFVFNVCMGCQGADEWLQFGYYFVFVVIFQFGWACVQISHLALIPDLTTRKSQRTELNSIRYAFTVLANLSVFTITFLALNTGEGTYDEITGDDPTNNETFWNTTSTASTIDSTYMSTQHPNVTNHIGPEDASRFRRRCELPASCGGEKAAPAQPAKMRKVDWFKELPFYQIAALYMATRLYVNLYQAYIPLYVQDTLKLDQTFLATVPFAMYLAGFAGSLVMKEINKKIGRKRTFALGCCVGIAGCVWLWFGGDGYYREWGIFLVGALLGIGGSTLLITSLSITADLIGENVEGGAFVFGFMSLVDKFSSGIIIMVIQESNPGDWYYRSVITFACGSACVLGIAVIISLRNVRFGVSRTRDLALSILEDSETSTTTAEESKCGIDNPAMVAVGDLAIQNLPPTTTTSVCKGLATQTQDGAKKY
ncbi:Major facilitator superfamily domain-containing protein 12 [Chionoecetes opilio]|uniref:Major facilitator superfamily domain-containing protein 12 n=1 Tax=Chionoecetes opilio TaxID=41210 RepID=A0A8J5CPF0_CHIOP|nr:Major facilitator superfamily domain-containing protein 12 [Chionoecetes opilio]